jgi:exodeoxyribonuclease VII large subunit
VYGLSLVISDIDQSFTLGNLEKQRLNTLLRLVKENPGKIYQEDGEYITSNKLLKLNKVLQRIALVASSNSEGFHDFMSNIQKNKFAYTFNIDYYFTSVQGNFAEEELKNTMIRIYESKKEYDCVVIIRGGGAKTDFLAFDTYGIARAVARFPVPVITGIGHLRDVSITDMMAHTNTNAPTKAAEFIIAHNRTFEDELKQIQKSVIIKAQQRIAGAQQKISQMNSQVVNKSRSVLIRYNNLLLLAKQVVMNKSQNSLLNEGSVLLKLNQLVINKTANILSKQNNLLVQINQSVLNRTRTILTRQNNLLVQVNQSVINKSKAIVFTNTNKLLRMSTGITGRTQLVVEKRQNNLEHIASNLNVFSGKLLTKQQSNLDHYTSLIRSMSPKNILKKGFAMVKVEGKIVKDAAGIEEGKDLILTLSDAEIKAKVISKNKLHGNENDL